jgi:two-component sensor histidine kinase
MYQWGIKGLLLALLCACVGLSFGQDRDSVFSNIYAKKSANAPEVYDYVDSLFQELHPIKNHDLNGHFWLWKGQSYLDAFDKTDSAFVFAYNADSVFKSTQNQNGEFKTGCLFAFLHIKDRNFTPADSIINRTFSLAKTTYDSARCLSLQTLSKMHRYDTTGIIDLAQKAIRFFERSKNRPVDFNFHYATSYRNLAWSYQIPEIKDWDYIALKHWHKALSIGSFSATKEAPTYLYILQNMVYCHRFIGQLDSAHFYMLKAEQVLNQGHFPNIHWQRMNFYRQYSWLEYERGNYKRAMDLLGVSRAETDDYYNTKMESTATAIANKYDQKLKQKEINNLSAQNKMKNKGLILQAIILVLLLGVTVFALFQYRKTKRQNAILAEQSNQMEALSKNLELSLNEIHHRIKNNLQIITSLLNVQKNKLQSAEAREALDDSQGRIRAIALVHEQLYSFSEFDELSVKHYTERVVESILQSTPPAEGVEVHMELDEANMELNQSVSMGIILNELLTNAIKYAFPNQSQGELNIIGKKVNQTYQLTIHDTGVGLPKGFDYKQSTGVGFRIIQALVMKLKASFSLKSENGTSATIIVPIN